MAQLYRSRDARESQHLWFAIGFGLSLLAVLGSIPWATRPLLRLTFG